MATLKTQKWEDVPHESGTYLSRLNVPGGWLVREMCASYVYSPESGPYEMGYTSSICFMPDPSHLWLAENE